MSVCWSCPLVEVLWGALIEGDQNEGYIDSLLPSLNITEFEIIPLLDSNQSSLNRPDFLPHLSDLKSSHFEWL